MKEKQALEVTPSPHTVEAKAFVGQIRTLRIGIPRLEPEGPNDARAMVSRASVDKEFVEAAGAAMEASDLLDGSSPTTADAMHDAIAFDLAYQSALTEAKAFVRALTHTLRAARATAGGHALDIYALAQRLAKGERRRARAARRKHAPQAQERTPEGGCSTRPRPVRKDGAETVVNQQ
jgi:hypothetical protein